MARWILAPAVLALLAGCSGARDVDYSPARAIAADIDATHFRGATSLYPGMDARDEPLGAFPWQLGERRQ